MKFTRLSIVLIILWLVIAISDALLRLWDYTQASGRYDIIAGQQNWLSDIWTVYAVVFIAALIVDRMSLLGLNDIRLKRKISGTLPVNSLCDVELTVIRQAEVSNTQNKSENKQQNRKLNIEVYDHFPETCTAVGLPVNIQLGNDQQVKINYQIKSFERGDLTIDKSELWVSSLLGLMIKRVEVKCKTVSRVYPNFRSIHNYVLLATEQRTRQLGIRQRQKRGEGLDFHQLREYRMGDSLRQIDWRSTSRLRKVISKEYQQERDQNIIFLVDSGRRMRTKDGELSHFDQALNATLLVSHIALKQGDAVGLKVFGGADRFIPPKKGPSTISVILNQVYDLQPSNRASDIIQAAEELNQSFKKRSLIVIVSNMRAEDQTELTTAVKMLKKHHLVLLLNLKEQALEDCLDEEIVDMRGTLRYSQTVSYLQQREQLHRSLAHSGVIAVDSLPKHLAVNMANQYFDIKRSGRL
jgi:uncharacterized protein (DUF58 family)